MVNIKKFETPTANIGPIGIVNATPTPTPFESFGDSLYTNALKLLLSDKKKQAKAKTKRDALLKELRKKNLTDWENQQKNIGASKALSYTFPFGEKEFESGDLVGGLTNITEDALAQLGEVPRVQQDAFIKKINTRFDTAWENALTAEVNLAASNKLYQENPQEFLKHMDSYVSSVLKTNPQYAGIISAKAQGKVASKYAELITKNGERIENLAYTENKFNLNSTLNNHQNIFGNIANINAIIEEENDNRSEEGKNPLNLSEIIDIFKVPYDQIQTGIKQHYADFPKQSQSDRQKLFFSSKNQGIFYNNVTNYLVNSILDKTEVYIQQNLQGKTNFIDYNKIVLNDFITSLKQGKVITQNQVSNFIFSELGITNDNIDKMSAGIHNDAKKQVHSQISTLEGGIAESTNAAKEANELNNIAIAAGTGDLLSQNQVNKLIDNSGITASSFNYNNDGQSNLFGLSDTEVGKKIRENDMVLLGLYNYIRNGSSALPESLLNLINNPSDRNSFIASAPTPEAGIATLKAFWKSVTHRGNGVSNFITRRGVTKEAMQFWTSIDVMSKYEPNKQSQYFNKLSSLENLDENQISSSISAMIKNMGDSKIESFTDLQAVAQTYESYDVNSFRNNVFIFGPKEALNILKMVDEQLIGTDELLIDKFNMATGTSSRSGYYAPNKMLQGEDRDELINMMKIGINKFNKNNNTNHKFEDVGLSYKETDIVTFENGAQIVPIYTMVLRDNLATTIGLVGGSQLQKHMQETMLARQEKNYETEYSKNMGTKTGTILTDKKTNKKYHVSSIQGQKQFLLRNENQSTKSNDIKDINKEQDANNLNAKEIELLNKFEKEFNIKYPNVSNADKIKILGTPLTSIWDKSPTVNKLLKEYAEENNLIAEDVAKKLQYLHAKRTDVDADEFAINPPYQGPNYNELDTYVNIESTPLDKTKPTEQTVIAKQISPADAVEFNITPPYARNKRTAEQLKEKEKFDLFPLPKPDSFKVITTSKISPEAIQQHAKDFGISKAQAAKVLMHDDMMKRTQNLGATKGDDPFIGLNELFDKDDKGYQIFSSVIYSARAIARVLLTYKRKHKIDTIDKLVDKYAPAGPENPEINRNGYKEHLKQVLKLDSTSEVFDIENHLMALVSTVIKHEGLDTSGLTQPLNNIALSTAIKSAYTDDKSEVENMLAPFQQIKYVGIKSNATKN